MKALDRFDVARRVYWSFQQQDTSWDDVITRRDARVLRVVRRLTRRDGGADRRTIAAAAMIERGGVRYGATADTAASLNRLMRHRLVVQLTFAAGTFYLAGDNCPTCGGPLG